MIVVGRDLISFLDGRYSDEGTEVAAADLRDAAKARVSVLSTAVASQRSFSPPQATKPETVRIQYDARVSDIQKIAEHLRKPGMSGSEVGRHTFFFFLRNEVGEP